MSSDWLTLGDVQYRKWRLYEMEWKNIAIEDYRLYGAPYGGPIAAIRDEKKNSSIIDDSKKVIIFSASGRKISEVLLLLFYYAFIASYLVYQIFRRLIHSRKGWLLWDGMT